MNEYTTNKKELMDNMKENWFYIREASPELKDDKEVALAAVQKSGHALRFVSNRLRDDIEVVKEAIHNNPDAFRYASVRAQQELGLYQEKTFADTIKENIQFYKNEDIFDDIAIYDEINNEVHSMDKDDIEEFMDEYGLDMKENEAENIQAVVNYMKENKEEFLILTDFIEESKFNVYVAEHEELNQALRARGEAYKEAELNEVCNILHKNGWLYTSLREDLQNNKEIALAAVRYSGAALEVLKDEFKNDKDVVIMAIKNNPNAVKFASESIKADLMNEKTTITKNMSIADRMKVIQHTRDNNMKDNKDTKSKDDFSK